MLRLRREVAMGFTGRAAVGLVWLWGLAGGCEDAPEDARGLDAAAVDLAVDLGLAADLAVTPDLAVSRDLAVSLDLAVSPDLAVTSDLGPAPDASAPDPLACNGARHLCARPLPAVAFAMTHNAHAVMPPFNRLAANQTIGIAEQLALGVRALGIKLYVTDDARCGPLGLYGYHGFPNLGCVPFADIAAPIAACLASHPREVLVVTVEGDADAASVRAGLDAAGLTAALHVQPPGADWPSLGALIDADHRLVLFKDHDADPPAGLHAMWDLIQDTPYDHQDVGDFSCDHLRGAADAPLFLLNHFLTRLSPVPAEAPNTNALHVLGPRVLTCAETRGLPTLVYVDFVQWGDTLAVVAALNGPGDEAERRAALAALIEAH
jgi:hypothetical protein